MSKYNILYLHNKSDISGGERSLLGLWENLDKWTFSSILMVPFAGNFSHQASQLGIKIIFYSFPQLRPWNLLGIVQAFFFLRKTLAQEQIHLIHSYTARNNILASIIGRSMHIPVIWHERNIPEKGEMDITKMLLFLPDAVICNSNAVAMRLGELPSKVKIILNGVDLTKFTPMAANDDLKKKYGCEGKQIVGIVTNLTERRRVEYFIKVAGLVHTQDPNVVFFIVGGEFEDASKGRRRQLETYSQELGLGGSLFFIDMQDDVRPWIALFDVSCHVASQDACSRSLLEAMSMERAIVAVDDGGNLELIESSINGILIDPFDHSAFVNAVLSLLGDKERRKTLGKSARIRAQQYFDIHRNVQETQEFYFQCLRGK